MDSQDEQPRQRWSTLKAATLYGVVVLCLLAAMVWTLRDHRHRELDAARDNTLAQAELIAEWASGAFARIDDTLSGLADLYALSLNGEGDERLAIHFETLASLRRQNLPFLDAIGIIDPAGQTLYSMGNPGFPGEEPEERAFIHRFLQVQEPMRSDVYWSPGEDEHRMLYLRRMFDAEGRVIGVAAARLDLFFFTHALESIPLGEGHGIAFLDDDMRLIARRPGVPDVPATRALGMRVESPEVAERIRDPRSQSVTVVSPLDGSRRIVGIGRVEGLPFAAMFGHEVDHVLADCRQRAVLLSLGWLSVSLLGLLILVHYLRLARTEADLQKSEKTLRDINQSLEAELRIAAMAFETHLGMFITDATGTIRKVNGTFERITGYSAKEVLGRNPRLLNSGRHDAGFYRNMWSRIQTQGSWQGEVWNRRKNGDTYPQWVTISAVKGDDGNVSHYVATLSDMTHRKEAEREAHRLAFYDPLTGLPNRRMLLDRVGQVVESGRCRERRGALLFIDLDGFKHINDSLGHQKGDELLQLVATRIVETGRETDLVARLGGDEFVVLAQGMGATIDEASQVAERLANKLLGSLAEPCWLGAHRYLLSGSIGIALLDRGTRSVEECLQQAEMAMYQAKQAGRNTLRFFDPDMQAIAVRRAMLETDLRQAVKRNQLRLFYQVQVDASAKVTGVEALLRWEHPEHGMVPPSDFIPVAEEGYLIVVIGGWVLETACRQLAAWAGDPVTADWTMAVNISPLQFQQPDFVAGLEAILAATGARPRQLKLELTETLFMKEPETVRDTMCRLKTMGIRFSLDDFGTGYSSLAYLNRLPLDQLKIDQSFVRTLFEDAANAVISASIIDLGRNLGLEVIAEGVETQAHRDWLADHGCHAYQGYFYSRPLPAAQLMELLESSGSLMAGPNAG
ncbi:bifunctional diguanylate cyclase/phosphodiesterase [Billgrantia endophytica]|uniref:cyclic-guanylate-specific phosphodiesterase n=1 Tax=Billgrantia endophytica TaxID=2033802 RepID=A0A2N7U118_9GAMM|nr:EAL domain-containing protein [Halomonas endophytica]PMR74121.1 GGDEF domain-containing protein [Halomonas endophytica]